MLKRLRPLLGTFVEIAIAEPGSLSATQAEAAISAAFSCIEKIQQQLSFHDPASELSRLNSAPYEWHPLTKSSIQCLKLARALTRISAGKFNCTLGKQVVDKGALPPLKTNHPTLASGDWQDLELSGKYARLQRPVWITLDGIAKGFAVDSAIKTLQLLGVASAWVNAGGDIRVYGSAILPISVRDHLGFDHAMGGLQNAAIATSTSTYTEETPGILLTAEGNAIKPATWTVIAHSAWRADALTKVAANTPPAIRSEYIRQLGGRWVQLAGDSHTNTATFSTQQLSE